MFDFVKMSFNAFFVASPADTNDFPNDGEVVFDIVDGEVVFDIVDGELVFDIVDGELVLVKDIIYITASYFFFCKINNKP